MRNALTLNEITEFAATPSNNEYHHIQGKIMPFGNKRVLVLLMDMTLQHNLEKMRRDFIANVSHELRSPLTSLIGFVETLKIRLILKKTCWKDSSKLWKKNQGVCHD